MLNYALFNPKNFILIGLMGLVSAILTEHIYNTLVEAEQE